MTEIDEGSVIGNYRVVRLLGQGGMGTVYEVEHLELGTHYALKTFTFDLENDAAHALKTKFLEEGKLLARLKHANLTHVFDLGFEEGSQMPYFVMDLVTYEDGETYTVEDIDLKDIDEEMVYNWFGQLASALDYIHGEGIVHRDIKPSNLLVDKDLNVVLTDFGISRIFGSKIKSEVEATRTMVTKTGRGKLVLGTEHYIAPEVAEGEEATPQADAYSLGVMLLRWLTGFYYGDNPGAIAMLSNKKYRWLGVISQLLAPAGRRPETYTELIKQLKPNDGANSERAKPVGADPRAARKKRKLKENILAAFCALFVVGVIGAGGYFGWQYVEKKNAERDRQYAELKQRMEADRAAAEKKEAEENAAAERKAAEEKRIAEEKEAARKAKIAERERAEAARTKIEKQDPSTLTVRQTPKIAETKPEPEKPKEEFVVVKDDAPEEDVKDYGPIPDKKYVWLKGGNVKFPQEVKFFLANGDSIDLIPQKPNVFYMSNDWSDGKRFHKVTITRPFWMSKYCITANQWREFSPNDCNECKQIENEVANAAVVCKAFQRHSIDAFCAYLTEKYHVQLPNGYVFRLPSEAELEYALDIEGTQQKYGQKGEYIGEFLSCRGKYAREAFAKFRASSKISRFGIWNHYGRLDGSRIFVGGWTMPTATGVYDLWGDTVYLLDTIKAGESVRYADEEIDPLTWCGPIKDGVLTVSRTGADKREYHGDGGSCVFHIVLGPDLIKEKVWTTKIVQQGNANRQIVQNAKVLMNPENVPRKISKAKEVKLKMISGQEMLFCSIPSGRFNMSNQNGDVKEYHKVQITKPFWMTRYCVTTKQWREWGRYDCEGMFRALEKYFPKNPIYVRSNRAQIEKYCEYLNSTYKNQIPKGYVFRLPTEAEWEWAFVADEKGDVRNVAHSKYNNYCIGFRNELAAMIKKGKVPECLYVSERGVAANGAYIGGRTFPNAWGVCDLWIDWCENAVLDTFDISTDKETEQSLCYDVKEEDPLKYAGILGHIGMSRCEGVGRRFRSFDFSTYFHIVVGQDLVSPLKEKEYADYPVNDLGGAYLGDSVVKVELSSIDNSAVNSDIRNRLMLSRENTLRRHFEDKEDVRGFHTQQEDSPWIQLHMRDEVQLTGLRVLTYMYEGQTAHLTAWVSSDGRRWREVAKESVVRSQYIWNLKNVRGKYIRIGREPGFRMHDAFALNKILIYGNEK